MTAAGNATTPLTRCQYCEHGNPADSKYCNACGATLTLAPCPHCGAVNQVTALACYQCRGALPASLTAALVPAPALTEVDVAPAPPRRAGRTLAAGVAALSLIAALGYFAFPRQPPQEQPPAAAVRSEASNRGVVDAGTVGRDAAPVDAKPLPGAETGVDPGGTASPRSETPPVAAIRGANQRRAARQPVESPAAAAGVAPGGARAQAVGPGKAAERQAARAVQCTEAMAALGLCVPKPGARPQPAEAPAAAKGSEREPPRQATCTEAVAALGLCTLKPIQRRE